MPPVFPSKKPDFNSASRREGKEIDAPLDAAGHTALHLCVQKGDLVSAARLLKIGAHVHQQDKQGQTPLYAAIAERNVDMVALLLKNGATFNDEDDAGRTPLMWAVEQKCDAAFLEFLRRLGAPLDGANKEGRQLLHVAAANDRPDVIDYLVWQGVAINVADAAGRTALHISVESGAHRSLQGLLGLGADPLIRTKEIKTPLHLAAAKGDLTAVDVLLDIPSVRQTIDTFQTYAEGFTPLMAAVQVNHLAVAERLLDIGADPNRRDNFGRGSLYIAVEMGHPDMVRKLIERGADVEKEAQVSSGPGPVLHKIHNGRYSEILPILYAAGANLEVTDSMGRTALHNAIVRSEWSKVKPLLALGADPNRQDNAGMRPIDLAAERSSYNSVYDVVSQLLLYHADPNISPHQGVQYTPLHWAAKYGQKELVNLLLDRGAAIDAHDRTPFGGTPLMASLEGYNREVTELLRQRGADELKKDRYGRTVLHLAAQVWNKDTLESFLRVKELSAGIDVQDAVGYTPLHYACRGYRLDCARALLDAGADPGLYDSSGKTPVHYVVSLNIEVLIPSFVALKEKKVDWNMPTRIEGDTPLHLAATTGYAGMVERLLSLGANASLANKAGQVPLHAAVMADRFPVVQLLIEHMKRNKIDYNRVLDNKGWAPLHYAVVRALPETLAAFFNAGADIHARTAEGDTPLHIAVRHGRREIVQSLLAKGADAALKNNAGLSVLETAQALKQEDLVAVLQQALQDRKGRAASRPAAPGL